jgi:hypothetical protein
MHMPCPRESWCGHRLGRNVLVELPIPELVTLGFREVGMSNPKGCLVGGHGPCEQLFVVDRMESHGAGVGVPYQEKEMVTSAEDAPVLSVEQRSERQGDEE